MMPNEPIIQGYKDEIKHLEEEIACMRRKYDIAQQLHRTEVAYWQNEVKGKDDKISVLQRSIEDYQKGCYEYAEYMCHFFYQRCRFDIKKTEVALAQCHKGVINSVAKRLQTKMKLLEKERDEVLNSNGIHPDVGSNTIHNIGNHSETNDVLNEHLARLKQQLDETTRLLNEERRRNQNRYSVPEIRSPIFSPSPIRYSANRVVVDSPDSRELVQLLERVDPRSALPAFTQVDEQKVVLSKQTGNGESATVNVSPVTVTSNDSTSRQDSRVIPESPIISSASVPSINSAVRKQLSFENEGSSPVPTVTNSVQAEASIATNPLKRARGTHEESQSDRSSGDTIIQSSKKARIEESLSEKKKMAKENGNNLTKLFINSTSPAVGFSAKMNDKTKRSSMGILAQSLLFSDKGGAKLKKKQNHSMAI